MDLIKELNRETLAREVPKVQIGDTVRVHVKVKEGSRERIQVFEAGLRRRSLSAASPMAWVWKRCSLCTLPRSTPFRLSATVRCAGLSCIICAAAWARAPRSRKSFDPKIKRGCGLSFLVL